MNLGKLAEENVNVFNALTDSGFPHTEAAHYITQGGFPTTESSVRRWRNANAEQMRELPSEEFDDSVFEEALPGEAEAVAAGRVEELEEQNKKLRQSLNNTLGKLADAKAKSEDLANAVYDAAADAIAGLDLKPVTVPAPDRRKSPEVAVAVLGDWQLAKVTRDYSSAVCEDRIELYGDKVLKLTDIQRADHPVEELHVFLLGDLVEGELIFPGQQHLIDASLYEQVCISGPRILGNFLRKMMANFKKVHVSAIPGNHGRVGGRASADYNPETNADRMLYRITQQLLAHEERLTWDIPDGNLRDDTWYTVAKIGNYSSMLFHGGEGQISFNMLGINRKVSGWAMGAIPEHFTDIDFGHYHQPTQLTINRVTVRVNGSTESSNNFAAKIVGAIGRPSQGLRFVDPRKGLVTTEYPKVWLDES